jgi:hypothetical protein
MSQNTAKSQIPSNREIEIHGSCSDSRAAVIIRWYDFVFGQQFLMLMMAFYKGGDIGYKAIEKLGRCMFLRGSL